MKAQSHTLALALALATGLLLQATTASADILLVERVQVESAALPARGQSMAQIEAAYGVPQRKHAPVAGPNSRKYNPPITRWDYPAFSVYFEYNHVVDAVAAKSQPDEIGPKPVQ
ncbi:hypothetical protein [Arenimonas sp.]|uniref:hypothetical protein n=1 Tax=Arenimonas sp. TaxID=1872635 RepID=UPI0035AE9CA1